MIRKVGLHFNHLFSVFYYLIIAFKSPLHGHEVTLYFIVYREVLQRSSSCVEICHHAIFLIGKQYDELDFLDTSVFQCLNLFA